MKRTVVALVLATCWAAPLRAQQGASLTPQQWREDIRYVADALVRNHVDAFHTAREDAFRDSTEALIARIEGATDAEIVMGLSALAASIEDAHTYLRLPTDGPLAFRPYGVRFEWLADGLAIGETSEQHAALVGARVDSIGGISPASAVRRASRYLYRENEWTARISAPRVLGHAEAAGALGLAGPDGALELVLTLPDGRTARTTVHAEETPIEEWLAPHDVGAFDPPRYLRHRDRLYWFERIDDLDAWYVQFNSARDAPDESIAAFAARLADSLDARPAGRLVLDLRWNVGGSSAATVPLVRTLVALRESTDPRFFVVTGRWTLSASIVMLGDLVRFLDPVLVGEPTGARPNLYGENPFTDRAPHSGLRFTWATQYFQPFGPDPQPEAVLPTVAALTTRDDLLRGRDPALEAIATYEPRDLRRALLEGYETAGMAGAAEAYDDFRGDPANAFRRPFDVVRRFGRDLAEDGLDGTLTVYRWLMRDYPERARSWELMGSVYQDLGRLEEARSHYLEALERLPGDTTVSRPLRYALDRWLTERLGELPRAPAGR